jgi:beta-glucosidase
MYRFSFDFARLSPAKGQFNERLMAEYIKTLALIRAHGQEPFVTLHHFTMPRYLVGTDRSGNITTGAWENPEVVQHFRFYLANIIRCLTDKMRVAGVLKAVGVSPARCDAILQQGLVQYFMTINEPAVTLFNGYINGTSPPYKKGSVLTVSRVLARLVDTHDVAREELKRGLRTQSREPQVCIGHNWQYLDGFVGKMANEFQVRWTEDFERNGKYSDFLGLHYYFRETIPLSDSARKLRDYSDQPAFGDVYPAGILAVLKMMHAKYPQKEIFVSEIGFSDRRDGRRPFWLLETVRYIIEAMIGGVPIKGVLLWTLVDNFEWDLGMSQKFGLFSEAELTDPLAGSPNHLFSWEVWRAVTTAITSPTLASLGWLQTLYEGARGQYREAGGRYSVTDVPRRPVSIYLSAEKENCPHDSWTTD